MEGERREYTLKEKRSRALALFDQGYNCAQAVAGACCPAYGVDESAALRLSCAMGGGLGGSHREVCGAALGAVMAAGASVEDDSPTGKAQANPIAKAILADFFEKNHSLNCGELLRQADIKEKSAADPRLKDYPKIRPCARYVLDAVDSVDAHCPEKN